MKLFKSLVSQSLLATTVLGGLMVATPALAEDSAWDVSANAAVVSDYRFRGVSLSDKEVAVQGGFDVVYTLNDSISLFAGNWNSTLYDGSITGDFEHDFYAGLQGKLGTVDWKLGAVAYLYSDASNSDYVEIYGSLTQAVGPVSLTGGFAFAPSQDNFGGERAIYVNAGASYTIPDTGFALNAGIGLEDNAFYNNKLDWTVGLTYTKSVFSLGIAYVDTDVEGGTIEDPTVVATLKVTF
jgi:uncharacterized protein (TIGR02001 family)